MRTGAVHVSGQGCAIFVIAPLVPHSPCSRTSGTALSWRFSSMLVSHTALNVAMAAKTKFVFSGIIQALIIFTVAHSLLSDIEQVN